MTSRRQTPGLAPRAKRLLLIAKSHKESRVDSTQALLVPCSAPMDVDFTSLSPKVRYKLLTALVVPRPIAWITTLNGDGKVNAAPYSFFNVMGNRPPIVAFGPGDRPDGSRKDSERNIEERREFVVNLVHPSVAEAMHHSAAPLDPDTSETEALELETEASQSVEIPRIAACKVHLECKYWGTIEVEQNRIVLGVVKHLHAADGILDPTTHHIAPGAFEAVGRLQGPGWYCTTGEQFDLGAFPRVEALSKKS